jgi:eukaryotic-like serine/threonine-protein kinase
LLKHSPQAPAEAAALTALRPSPHLPTLRYHDTHWIALDWIEGQPLTPLIPLSWPQLQPLLEQLLRILESIHQQSWLHADLSLSNLLLTSSDPHDQRLVLLDWGCAKPLHNALNPQLIGSLHYMAPELFEPPHQHTPQTDLYALGVLCYELLTGTMPFQGDSKVQLLTAHHLHQHLPLSHYLPQLPTAVDTWWQQLTARQPTARFTTATTALHHLPAL